MAAGLFDWPEEAELYLTRACPLSQTTVFALDCRDLLPAYPNSQNLAIKARIKAMDAKNGG